MSYTTPLGYCPQCRQNVLMKREEINYCLAIILFFTGIGLLIYLIIYFSKREDKCVHCGMRCQTPNQNGQITYQTSNVTNIQGEKAIFCPLCGSELDKRNQNFCPSCGSNID